MIAAVQQGLSGPDALLSAADPVAVRLRLIGQMEAWTLTSDSILPTGRKTRALLAILALSAPRPVLRGKLAEMLWSRRPEEQARASLRQEIHRLLEALNPVGAHILAISRDHLALRAGTVWVDVEEVLRATPAKPAALALLDGDLLEDLDGVDPAFDNWLASERERLCDRARTLGEALLREKTEPEEMILAAQQLLSIDRAHEGAWRTLMRAYMIRGERGMAVQAYERCRTVLADQLDAQPSEETQRLLAELRASGSGQMARPTFPPATPQPTSSQPLGFRPSTSPPPRTEPRQEPRPEARPSERGELQVALRQQERPAEQPPEARPDARAEPRTRGGARIGVLPLQLVGTTEAEAHLSTSLADEITAALARFRWMFLVSSSSLARAQTRDETTIRRNFGLDYLLDGTVQRVGERLRISLRLLDLRAGNQVVWSRRFDRGIADLLTLEDEIASEVVGQIDPEILLIEAQRVATRPPADATAYDLMLRALPLLGRLERPLFMQAGDLLRQAIAQEPDFAAAHAWCAYWQMFLVGQGWTSDPQSVMAEAGRLAERAIMLDPQDAKALSIAGHVRAYLHHRLREATALHERALTLNPNLAMAWNLSGVAYAYLGDLEEAERRVRRYKKLSPLDPHAFFYDTAFIIIALLKRDYEAAIVAGRDVSEMNPGFSAACKPYLAALGHLGQAEEAAVVLNRLLAIEPGFTIRAFLEHNPLDRPQDRDHYADGLRLAGVPE
jgi:DNA-binding SARP family transcriptional activator/TolB-like protein